MKIPLAPGSTGVVHNSACRTRLRVPDEFRQDGNFEILSVAVKGVPAVQQVRIDKNTGTVVIRHESDPNILRALSVALDDSVPEILEAMTVPAVENSFCESNRLRRILPYAFIVAGFVKLLQDKALWRGVPALVLFYYAFDSHWKLNRELTTKEVALGNLFAGTKR